MGRAPCCDKANVKKGPWSPEEDAKLKDFIEKFGTGGNWIGLPQKAGLKRCGKSCRLRWLNYLRPNIKHGEFTDEEDKIICTLYSNIGSRWSIIAGQLPGRTDNDIKNYWNTKLKKKLMGLMVPSNQNKFYPTLISSHQPLSSNLYNSSFYSSQPTTNIPQNNYLYYNNNNSLPLISTNYYHQDFHHCNYINNPLKDHMTNNHNMLMFGGNDQASTCSSSDGSCSQISYGNNNNNNNNKQHLKQEEMVVGNCFVQENQKFMLQHYNNDIINSLSGFVDDQKPRISGILESCSGAELEYGILEEVKQLISTSNCNLVNDDDEDKEKEKEKGMMYYY
ncbi:hypothetical protein RD792_009818 [Penstemon davidsonii]|uniref:Uncharacterized protein n=1 Tax=Penstemon davidsonii TaxID=160366 RepID=A0ABR0D0X2_9LAMI|nr:hypothetical protein RD792_009818 [Penstemon davidsonii]